MSRDRWPVASRRALAASLLAVACTAPAPGGSGTATAGEPATVASLERAARAMVRTDGCTSSAGCRSAPVGWKACGGPRDYVVYCAATTDSAALFRKLDELKAMEVEHNRASGAASDCMLRLPPTPSATGGICRQAP